MAVVEVVAYGGRVELTVLLQAINGVLTRVCHLLHTRQLPLKVLIDLDDLANVGQLLFLFLDLFFLCLLLRGFGLVLVVLSVILDAFGLCHQDILEEFNEDHFFLYFLLHHFAHVGVVLGIYATTVLVIFQLDQHALQTCKIQIDVLIIVDSCIKARVIFSINEVNDTFPSITQSFADAFRHQFFLLCFIILPLLSLTVGVVSDFGFQQNLQLSLVLIAFEESVFLSLIAFEDFVISLDEQKRKFTVVLKLDRVILHLINFNVRLVLFPLNFATHLRYCDLHASIQILKFICQISTTPIYCTFPMNMVVS